MTNIANKPLTERGQTNHDRVDSEEEIDRQEREDPDLFAIPDDWWKHAKLETGIPVPPTGSRKRAVTMRFDPDIVEYFERQGRGWQTRIHAVLRAFVDGQNGPRR